MVVAMPGDALCQRSGGWSTAVGWLHSPAVQVSSGEVVSTDRLVRARLFCSVAADALQTALGVPVNLNVASGQRTSGTRAAWTVRMEVGHTRATAWCHLDHAACAAVISAVYEKFAGVRARFGHQTPLDDGAVEFAALLVADAWNAEDQSRPPAVLVSMSRTDDSVPAAGPHVTLDLRVGSLCGEALLGPPAVLDALPLSDADAPHTEGEVDVGIGLRGIRLDASERRAASPGDLLTLGAGPIGEAVNGLCLFTINGWDLGPVTLSTLSPSVASVRVNSRRLRAHPALADWREGVFVPVIGDATIDHADLRRLDEGTGVDLAMDCPNVRLVDPRGVWARGELVRYEGEMAVRLMDIAP